MDRASNIKGYNENYNFEKCDYFRVGSKPSQCHLSPFLLAANNGHIGIAKELLPYTEDKFKYLLKISVDNWRFKILGNDYKMAILQLLD